MLLAGGGYGGGTPTDPPPERPSSAMQVVDGNVFGPVLKHLGCTGSQPMPAPGRASGREDEQRAHRAQQLLGTCLATSHGTAGLQVCPCPSSSMDGGAASPSALCPAVRHQRSRSRWAGAAGVTHRSRSLPGWDAAVRAGWGHHHEALPAERRQTYGCNGSPWDAWPAGDMGCPIEHSTRYNPSSFQQ